MAIQLNLSKRENHDVSNVSKAKDYSASEINLAETEIARDKIRDNLEKFPKHSPEDLTQDYVFQLGAIAALNAVLEAPQRAQVLITKKRR